MVDRGHELIADLITLKRGDEVWLYGEYLCIVARDTNISVDPASREKVPLTNILAFGDAREESIYTDYYDYKDITLFKTLR